MFSTLIAAQESLGSATGANVDALIEQAELDLQAALDSDALLKDTNALRTFGTLVTQTNDPTSLIQLADTDGGLSALMGVADTDGLLVLSLEELSDAAAATADSAEAAEGGEEGDAKKSNRKKWLIAGASAAAALAAIGAGIAGYKYHKANVPEALAGSLLRDINAVRKYNGKGQLDKLPENPTFEMRSEVREAARTIDKTRKESIAQDGADVQKKFVKAADAQKKDVLAAAKRFLGASKKLAAKGGYKAPEAAAPKTEEAQA